MKHFINTRYRDDYLWAQYNLAFAPAFEVVTTGDRVLMVTQMRVKIMDKNLGTGEAYLLKSLS